MKLLAKKIHKGVGAALAALLLGLATAWVMPHLAAKERNSPSSTQSIIVYKHPQCGCCGKWVDHLEANGFAVTTVDREDMTAIKEKYGVFSELASCHTAMAEGFVIEGHVPAEDIKRLLEQRPEVVGISVPGMPMGSPGMEVGGKKEPYQVLIFDAQGRTAVFAAH